MACHPETPTVPRDLASSTGSTEGTGQSSRLERQTYSIDEAAKILGICRTVAYRKGVLPTVRIAGRRLVPRRALERMLAETA
jgi:hypothetical protein